GRCDCPYDLMRNGRLCGGRSAYSKPGGRSPV
ncbi:MAG: SH3 domain-containing protein, partial [Mesorhizobium sp.]